MAATAGNDINIIAGSASLQREEVTVTKKKGFFSSKTTTTRDTLNETTALASSFSADTVTMQAGHDLNLTGSNLVATNDVNLAALNNVNIEAAANTRNESHFVQVKKSGLLGGGGIGFSIGTQKQSTDSNGTSTTASASTVGSTAGNVTIEAGKNYKQTGSDVLAPQGDIDISAQKIDIVEAQNTNRMETETKFSKSGVTIAITSPVITAIQTASQMGKAASQTQDGRMKALAGATAGLSAQNAYDTVTADPSAGGGIGVSIMFGGSKSESKETQASSVAAGSTVAAGHDINLTATTNGVPSPPGGEGQGEGSLTIQGSAVKAGNDINLKADEEINLLAAKNTAEQNSTNKSSRGGIGVSVTYGSNGFAAGVTLSASGARGKADGKDETWTNTNVEAGNKLTLESGGDTTMKGAVASGKQVVADVGGDLNVESLQDTSVYKSKNESIGGSVTIGYGFAASVNASKSSIKSDYASVNEQSGIKAGDEGFQVNVNGNTDLKGAVIASTDKAVLDGKNMLTTATLTTSDIANRADYKASSFGIGGGGGYGSSTIPLGGGSSASAGGTTTPLSSSGSSVSAGAGKDSGSASSVTKSGVSGIAGNKDVRTGDAETGIAKIFDKDKVQKEVNAQMQITQAFSQQAPKAVADYATQQTKPYTDARKSHDEASALLDKETDPGKREQLQEVVVKSEQTMKDNQTAYNSWKENGSNRIAANILVGAMGGGVSGAASSITKESLSWAADQMRQAAIEDSKKSPGIIDKNGYILDNKSGKSVGVNGDGVKIAGGRVDLYEVCGVDRCIQDKDTGVWVFQGDLKAYLEKNPTLRSSMGGLQGAEGQLTPFGDYPPGSLSDKVAEAYAGTHDTFNSPIWYGPDGNIKPGMTEAQQAVGNVINYLNVIPATPFALSVLLPPEMWNAIQVGIKVVKP